jgi:hypothetical protein
VTLRASDSLGAVAPSRRAALAMGVVAAVIAGLVVAVSAVTAHASGGLNEKDLALHGRSPTSAVATLSINTNQQYPITGHVAIDFVTGAMEGTIDIPEILSNDVASFIYVPGTLYVSVPNLVSTTHAEWVAIPTTHVSDNLAGLAREIAETRTLLSHPSSVLGVGSSHEVDTFTTFHFVNASAHLRIPIDVPVSLPPTVTLSSSITTGSSGQFAASDVSISAPHLYYAIIVMVQSYDHPVTISVPSPRDVTPISNKLRHRVFGTTRGRLNMLFSPRGIAGLFTISVT